MGANQMNKAYAEPPVIKILNFSELSERLQEEVGKNIVVVNYWATWCKPCVAELPHFEQLHKNYESKGVKVLLVSNDFVNEFDTRLKPFVLNKKLQCEVIGLNEPDPNQWLDKVEAKWSGAIPFTIIYDKNGKKASSHNGQMNYEELEKMLLKTLKP